MIEPFELRRNSHWLNSKTLEQRDAVAIGTVVKIMTIIRLSFLVLNIFMKAPKMRSNSAT